MGDIPVIQRKPAFGGKMLHLYDVPDTVVVHSESYRAMQEVISRLMLMQERFEYHHTGSAHSVRMRNIALDVIGPPNLPERVHVRVGG